MRGAGGCGGPATAGGVAGRCAAGGADEAATEGAAGTDGATVGATGGAEGRGGCAAGTGGAGAETEGAGRSTGADTTGGRGAGAGTVGAGGCGAAAGGCAATGEAGFAAGGTTAGLATTGTGGAGTGRTGGAAAASFFWVIAFSTSPGREMCDKSILVLISSSPRKGRAERADDVCASAEPRMWARTFSASCSSSELEWVFFSVTPTSGSASRMALLLTSSSLARSLIRTLLIRPFFSPRLLGLHRNLTESASCTRIPSNLCARAMIIL